MIVLLTLALLICGCQEQFTKPDLRGELFNLRSQDQTKWNEKYGDSLDSKQTSNIALITQVINKQGEAMKQLDSRLAVLEDPNTALGGQLRWIRQTSEKKGYLELYDGKGWIILEDLKRDLNKKYWEEYDK